MHTLLVILAGLLLCAASALLGHAWGGMAGAVTAMRLFVPTWAVLAGVNAWVGVARAGYPLPDELAILVVVAAIPSGAALLAARTLA